MTPQDEGLLADVRVIDLSGSSGGAVTRLLADLGADVLKIEPVGGSAARRELPTIDGVSIPFALRNANKRGAALDPSHPADRALFFDLVGGADIVVDDGATGQAAAFGTTCAQLADRFEQLVAMSVTDFGTEGPRACWRATDPVLYAMSGALSRSGPASGAPVLPPDGIASATAAVQAAWAVLVAYFNRLRCGRGDYIDFSRFDAVVLALDPPFGTHGQAATARSTVSRWRGRPRYQDAYPIFACRDGYVRVCILAPRQWRGMRAWLGEPEQFQDPKFDSIAARTQAFGELGALIADFFAGQTVQRLVADGQEHGVPIAAVLTPAEALQSDHLAAVGALVDTELAPGVMARVPVGCWVVDGAHAGYRTPAPALGSSDLTWRAERFTPVATGPVGGRPLEGIRVVDLGVIVAGAELSRSFGDLGAEVIKVESSAYPDGLRQKRPEQAISESFARAHRNNLGIGLELRSPGGTGVFTDLVSRADAVFANFKPGTLAALGFPYDRLAEINPGLVLVESSAFGDRGPWSNRMGYGPLVRASIGVTRLWTSSAASAAERHPFFDATTIFPDHVVGRISAIGALAALIRRRRVGVGARIHVSQAEVAINQLDTLYVAQAAAVCGVGTVVPDPADHRVVACAGDDEWCVVSLRGRDDRTAVATVVGQPGDDALARWAATHSPVEVAAALQAAGVPAAAMNRAADLHEDSQLMLRKVFSDMVHPLFEHPLLTEAGPAPFRHIPPALHNPAPLPGADTRRVCRQLLGMDDATVERLIAEGVLFTAAADGERTGMASRMQPRSC